MDAPTAVPPVLPPPPPPLPVPPPVFAVPAVEPACLRWQRVYLGAMAAIYLACVVGGALLLVFRQEIADWPPRDEPWEIALTGGLLLGLGVVFLALYVAGFFLPRRPWAWVAHLVLIAFGLTSCCTMPAAIPLLVAFLRRDTQAWFGR